MKKMSAFLLAMFIIVISFSSCSKYDPSKVEGSIVGLAQNATVINRQIPDFPVDENGDFTVLQLTDTHLFSSTQSNDVKTLEQITKATEETKADLVIATGDMVDGYNEEMSFNKKAALTALADIFENAKQYWAYVPGNNDGEYMGSNEDVLALFSGYKYFIASNVENISRSTHYSIDLKKSGEVVHSLIFLDSGSTDENHVYDSFNDDQLDWLDKTITEKGDCPVSLFFHMNTPNFIKAGQSGVAYSKTYPKIVDNLKDGIPPNEAFDSVVEKHSNVKLLSTGHLHLQTDMSNLYNNICYNITRASGYNSSKKPGCTLITIHTSQQETEKMFNLEEIEF